MRRINEIYLVVAVTCLFIAACGGGTAARWNGGMYEGDVIVDGVRPTDAKPEKRDKSIYEAVKKIFKNYPPKQKT